jgi:hypothetical protein
MAVTIYLIVSLILAFGFFFIEESIENKIKEMLDKCLEF